MGGVAASLRPVEGQSLNFRAPQRVQPNFQCRNSRVPLPSECEHSYTVKYENVGIIHTCLYYSCY